MGESFLGNRSWNLKRVQSLFLPRSRSLVAGFFAAGDYEGGVASTDALAGASPGGLERYLCQFAGFEAAPIQPSQAFYSRELREFILSYDVVREAGAPDDLLLKFLRTTYSAAADLAHWNRGELERQ